jgi:hypothetical protein
MWYKTTPINGAPGAISAANGWNLVATGTFNGVAVTSGTNTQTFLSNLTFILPANTTYGIAVCAYSGSSGRQRYSTLSAGAYNITAGGVTLKTGTNIGYASGVPPTAPSIANRGWVGKIHFMPACEGPGNLAANNITTSGADITWNPVTGSQGYEYVLDQNPGNPSGAGTPTSATTYQASGLQLATTYYFHVRNKCTNTFSSWVHLPFTTQDAYCKPPTNVLYSNLTTTSVDVLWSKMPTSDHYEYLYDVTSSIVPTSANSISTNQINVSLGSLKPETKYYFFIRSICLGGNDSSTWRLDSFITKAECKAPEVVVNNFNTLNPSASWNKNPIAIYYEYRVTSSQLSPAYGEQITDTFVNLALPDDNSDQYLHVRCKCNSQFTFSEWATEPLRLTPTSITFAGGVAPQVYPNPAHDKLFIKGAAGARVVIIDIKGVKVGEFEIKEDVESIRMGDYASGVYMLKCITNEGFINYVIRKE